MILSTKTAIAPVNNPIAYGDGILFLGSCFADEVGSLSKGLGFNAMVNPFGVLFNPKSIANAVERLSRNIPFTHNDVIKVNDEFYCTFSHGTAFWQQDKKTLLDKVNDDLETASRHFKNASHIVISLGTSWVYQHKESGKIVANCHKMPANLFERCFMSVQQTSECLSQMLNQHPDKHFIFTVSPLRHLKDGLHENQLSKASLLLAVEQVCKKSDNAYYFPAYEIMMDELRDYRFYKEDMIHPSEQAVEYIWEKFVDFAIADSERPVMLQAGELKQMYQHHAFFPESKSYQSFIEIRNQKEQQLKERFPAVVIENLLR